MPNSRTRSWSFVEHLLPLGVLAILFIYIYAFFFRTPYYGFFYNPSSNQIINIYVQADPAAAVQKGDEILQVGSVTREMFLANNDQPLFTMAQRGQVVPITVLRNGQELVVPWVYPGTNRNELVSRLLNTWWLALIFWVFGLATQLFMRPRDERWYLMLSAYYLTGLWVIFGNLSAWQIWKSSVLLHSVTWLMVPVYLNLHWNFPKPLRKVPLAVWIGLYSIAALLAVGQFLQWLPRSFYMLGFVFMLLGSIMLLIIHSAKQPAQRREVGSLAIALLIALAPTISLGIVTQFVQIPNASPLALLALPIMPAAYFFIIYRRQLGGLELRANRIMAFFVYGAILLTLAFPVALVINAASSEKSTAVILSLTFALLVCLLTAWVFPYFQRKLETRWLGMPLLPARVLEHYAARIITSLDVDSLKQILCTEILPSFQIRQAALFKLTGEARLAPVFAMGIRPDQLPPPSDIMPPSSNSDNPRPALPESAGLPSLPWVRLTLPLTYEGNPCGICLLGRRDPDDFYSAAELPTLQALMDQTALALKNIEQADHLHALYMADIERQELEQNRLALELHDEVLGQMALLAMSVADSAMPPEFDQAYQSATERIRQIITGLQPAMLSYGLQAALDELADDISDLGTGIQMELDIPKTSIRYDAAVELHIFRIIQQACNNALQHSQARNLRIQGKLELEVVELVVEDDGEGFAVEGQIDLLGLLASRHFGLAGMYERAALIGAIMTIESSPGQGTRISLTWRPEGARAVERSLASA